MRCNPGDLAVVVHPAFEANRGVLLRVLHLSGRDAGEWRATVLQHAYGHRLASGVFGRVRPGSEVLVHDWRLRPLRDGEGDDETLQWARPVVDGVPA